MKMTHFHYEKLVLSFVLHQTRNIFWGCPPLFLKTRISPPTPGLQEVHYLTLLIFAISAMLHPPRTWISMSLQLYAEWTEIPNLPLSLVKEETDVFTHHGYLSKVSKSISLINKRGLERGLQTSRLDRKTIMSTSHLQTQHSGVPNKSNSLGWLV